MLNSKSSYLQMIRFCSVKLIAYTAEKAITVANNIYRLKSYSSKSRDQTDMELPELITGPGFNSMSPETKSAHVSYVFSL